MRIGIVVVVFLSGIIFLCLTLWLLYFILPVKVKSSNFPVTADDSMDDSLAAAAMDADSDDEQLILGKKKQRSKSTAWIDDEAEDDDDDEFKGNESYHDKIM